jgi:hypothetical protein
MRSNSLQARLPIRLGVLDMQGILPVNTWDKSEDSSQDEVSARVVRGGT